MIIWKNVVGFEESHEVSNTGIIRSKDRTVQAGKVLRLYKGKVIKPFKSRGYLLVDLIVCGKRQRKRVHRAVAEAFIPNPQKLPDVEHINTVRSDNRVENLRWCTQKTNMQNPVTKRKLRHSCSKMFYKGRPAIEIAELNGISSKAFYNRISRGWSVKDACTKTCKGLPILSKDTYEREGTIGIG